jgi:hypothetical protein
VLLRRVAAIGLAWVVVIGLARGVVALPENCPPVTAADGRTAAEEAVGWFDRNQQSDGRWIYRYDRDDDVIDRSSHVVRQAGITLSLYQAHAAGIDGALEPADAGVEWLFGELVHHDDWSAVRRGGLAPTGGTALLVAALSTRYEATGDDRYDDEMQALGRSLVVMTEPSGAVGANWDIYEERPVPGDYSPFFTGETYFALALLATVDPTGEWGPTADRIGTYLATDRDRVEDRFPPIPDHWASYGMAQMAVGVGQPLSEEESDYAVRQAGLFSVSVRYESQRTDEGLNRMALRGPRVLGAGLGTLGEGLGSLWAAAGVDTGLAGERDAIGERLLCVTGMLVDRQVDGVEAEESGHPGLARGAWFHDGVTQMDDQQHALSALLLAEPLLTESAAAVVSGPRSADGVSAARAVWLAVVAVAVVNPPRLRRLVGRLPAGGVAAGSVGAGAAVALAAFVAGPLARAADVSPPTLLVAAGLVVAVAALVDAVVQRPGPLAPAGPGRGALLPLAFPGLVRPAVVLMAVATSAHGGVWVGLVVALAVAVSGATALLPSAPDDREGEPRRAALGRLLVWVFAVIAVVGGVDLVAHGVFSV